MKDFNPINRPIQPSQTLEVLSNSYNTIEQKHFETIKAASELQSAMAALDLNEAEDEFRQEKINEIKSTIEDNLIEGNAYAALPALIQKVGDINSDPRMIGKLRAQADFKAFQDSVNSRTDIPDDYKEYYKKVNPYKYSDTVDANGNIIGGSKWAPNETPVETVDINDVLKQAITYASPESGAYTSVNFIGNDGQVYNKWQPGVTINVLNTRTGQWERLTEEKLYEGVKAAMRANPKIRASLEQDFKIANFKYEEDGNKRDLFNTDGSRKTFSEYVDSIVDPFIKAKKYNNQISKDSYNEALLNQMAKENSNVDISANPLQVPTLNHGKNEVIKDTSKQLAFAQAQSTEAKLRERVSKLLPDIDPNIFTVNDPDALAASLRNKGINEEIITETIDYAKSLYENNREAIINYNDIMRKGEGNPKGIAAYQMASSLNTGMPINPELYQNNPEAQRINSEYQGLVDTYFDKKNGGVALINYVHDKERLNRFIKNIGGQQTLEELGITITYDSSGAARVRVPAEIGTRMNKFTAAFANAYDASDSITKLGNLFKRSVGMGDNIYREYQDGSITELDMSTLIRGNYNARTNAGAALNGVGGGILYTVGSIIPPLKDVSPSEMYSPFAAFKNRMERVAETAVGSDEKVVETLYAPGPTVTAANIWEKYKDSDDSKALTAAKKAIEFQTDLMLQHLVSIGMNNTGLLVYNDEKQAFIDIDTGDMADIENYVQNSEKTQKATGTLKFIPNIAQFGYEFTVPVKDEKAPKRFRFVDFKDENLQRLNADPQLAGTSAVAQAFENNRILDLGSSSLGYLNARAAIDQNGNKYFDVRFDDNSKFGNLTVKQVHDIKGVDSLIKYLAKRINTNTDEFREAYLKYEAANLGILSTDTSFIQQSFIKKWNNYANQ